jgi:nucleoside-diphosphate kinase
MQRTLVLAKPDAVKRKLVGKIIARLERKGLKLAGIKMLQLDDGILKEHYAHLTDKPFFKDIAAFMKSLPVIAMVWEGKNSVEAVRKIVGVTDPLQAELGTIRGDFALSIDENMIHASDSVESAEKEVQRFFQSGEVF